MLSKYTIIAILLLIALSASARPEITLLSNSIDFDLGRDLVRFLDNNGMNIVRTTADTFDSKKENKFVVILGGPDAPEGIGSIVSEVLSSDEKSFIRTKGNRKMYIKTNVWTQGQVVMIIAGSDRQETQSIGLEKKSDVLSRRQNLKEEEVEETPEPNETTIQAESKTKYFDVVAKRFEFVPGTIEVNQYDIVILNATSTDVTHGLSIAQFGVSETLQVGTQKIIEFNATKKGKFRIICSVFCGDGHGGMTGDLIVK